MNGYNNGNVSGPQQVNKNMIAHSYKLKKKFVVLAVIDEESPVPLLLLYPKLMM